MINPEHVPQTNGDLPMAQRPEVSGTPCLDCLAAIGGGRTNERTNEAKDGQGVQESMPWVEFLSLVHLKMIAHVAG